MLQRRLIQILNTILPASHPRWEYKLQFFRLDHSVELHLEVMNALGQDGWELVTAYATRGFFKRQIQP